MYFFRIYGDHTFLKCIWFPLALPVLTLNLDNTCRAAIILHCAFSGRHGASLLLYKSSYSKGYSFFSYSTHELNPTLTAEESVAIGTQPQNDAVLAVVPFKVGATTLRLMTMTVRAQNVVPCPPISISSAEVTTILLPLQQLICGLAFTSCTILSQVTRSQESQHTQQNCTSWLLLVVSHILALEESWSWTISPLFVMILHCGTCIKSRTTGAANSKLFLLYFS